jgi:hypothetical protein
MKTVIHGRNPAEAVKTMCFLVKVSITEIEHVSLESSICLAYMISNETKVQKS